MAGRLGPLHNQYREQQLSGVAGMRAAAKKQASPARSAFAAFVCGAESMEALVPVLAERGWPLDSVTTGGIEMAIRILGATPSPDILLVDLSESADPRGDIDALAEVCEPGVSVIAMGTVNDVRFYRELMDAGLLDYLVKPVLAEDLHNAIAHAEQAMRAAAEGGVKEVPNRLISVIGVRGGVGASLVSASASWIMANQLGRSVALLDLDLQFGTDALLFDLEPGRGLVDALENPSRVDSLFIERAAIRESENLAVLSAEASLTEGIQADPAALQHLIGELRAGYQVTVVDLPRFMAAQHPFLLGESTDILLVTDLSLAATRDCMRLLAFIKETAGQAQVRVVANRAQGGGTNEVEQKDFEASIERKVDWLLPEDMKSVVAAAKRAKPVVQSAPASKLVTGLKSMAEALVGPADAPAAEPFWRRLLQGGKK